MPSRAGQPHAREEQGEQPGSAFGPRYRDRAVPRAASCRRRADRIARRHGSTDCRNRARAPPPRNIISKDQERHRISIRPARIIPARPSLMWFPSNPMRFGSQRHGNYFLWRCGGRPRNIARRYRGAKRGAGMIISQPPRSSSIPVTVGDWGRVCTSTWSVRAAAIGESVPRRIWLCGRWSSRSSMNGIAGRHDRQPERQTRTVLAGWSCRSMARATAAGDRGGGGAAPRARLYAGHRARARQGRRVACRLRPGPVRAGSLLATPTRYHPALSRRGGRALSRAQLRGRRRLFRQKKKKRRAPMLDRARTPRRDDPQGRAPASAPIAYRGRRSGLCTRDAARDKARSRSLDLVLEDQRSDPPHHAQGHDALFRCPMVHALAPRAGPAIRSAGPCSSGLPIPWPRPGPATVRFYSFLSARLRKRRLLSHNIRERQFQQTRRPSLSRLILCADDFAYSRAVSETIVELAVQARSMPSAA